MCSKSWVLHREGFGYFGGELSLPKSGSRVREQAWRIVMVGPWIEHGFPSRFGPRGLRADKQKRAGGAPTGRLAWLVSGGTNPKASLRTTRFCVAWAMRFGFRASPLGGAGRRRTFDFGRRLIFDSRSKGEGRPSKVGIIDAFFSWVVWKMFCLGRVLRWLCFLAVAPHRSPIWPALRAFPIPA